MIKFSWKSLVAVVVAFGVGAGAYFALGASPAKVVPRPPVDPEWKPVEARAQDLALADARWNEHSPWGAVPKPAEAPQAPPPPPPMAVGIVKTSRGPEAIFMIHDAGEVRVAPGGSLPGGGRLLRIAGFRITWIDANGMKQEREMFTVFKPTSAPGESQASGATTVSVPSLPGPPASFLPSRSTQPSQQPSSRQPPSQQPSSQQPSQTPAPGSLRLPPGFTMPKPPGSQK